VSSIIIAAESPRHQSPFSFPLLLDCPALLTETKVENGDVSKQKWNLCYF